MYFWKVNRNYFNEKESHFTSRILNEVQERWPSILETVSVWSKSLTICRLWEPPHIKSFRFCSKRAWFEITICSFPKFVVSIEESNKIEVFISQRERERERVDNSDSNPVIRWNCLPNQTQQFWPKWKHNRLWRYSGFCVSFFIFSTLKQTLLQANCVPSWLQKMEALTTWPLSLL